MDLSKESKIHFIHQTIIADTQHKYYTVLQTLIEKYKIEHSSNINGIFLNLTTLDETIVDDIYNHFCCSGNQQEIITETEIKSEKKVVVDTHKPFIKDKLPLEKFDKYMLQVSRHNLSI